MASKIRLQDATDETLIEKCKEVVCLTAPTCARSLTTFETACDCDTPNWTMPPKNIPTTPPEGTVAIVVDVGTRRGAIYVHETGSDEYVVGVGIEEAGNVVMVPWDSSWFYYSIGSTRLAYMVKI